MILTCPECATRYFVGDDQVAASGRTVKCAACKTRWTAHPEPVLELSSSGEEGAVAIEPAPLSLDAQPLDALPGEELPKVFRAKAQTERRVREAATTGIVWAGMTAFLLVLMGGSFVLREDVVKLWPRSAAAFAAVGFPVNRIGLQIEDIRAEPALQDGHAALSVSGVIRNIRSETVTAPPLQISLVNKQDKRVMAKIAQASDPRVPAGETLLTEPLPFMVGKGETVWSQPRGDGRERRIFSLVKYYEDPNVGLYLQVEVPEKNQVFPSRRLGPATRSC
ncbi:MAG: hypothetical protein EBS42_08780 [Caulobacteraceae bacterium]|nr:hypothetical protein [Caulobacteraceae bacterium]